MNAQRTRAKNGTFARVAILGSGGFIGSHLAARLAADGHDVVAVDLRFPELRREWWINAGRRCLSDLRFDEPSDAYPTSLSDAIDGADYVFHLAADMGGVGYFHSESDAPAARANIRIDLNVLEACRALRVPFFYASSACAYPHSREPLHEGLLGLGPADQLYGEEKRWMTLMCAQEPLARVGVFHTIYGPGQEHEGPRTKFPPAIAGKVKVAARDGGEIEVWGDGSQVRTFLYIDDAVDRVLKVAFAERYDGPVNIGASDEVTIRGCADWLCEHAGIEPRYRFDESKPVGALVRGTDNSLFNARYGQMPTMSTRDGLVRLYDWLP